MIRIIMPYFCGWPAWMPLFLESCRRQEGYQWVLVGSEPIQCELPSNVRFVEMSLAEVGERIEDAGLALPCRLQPYKLCDYKPAYGLIFADLLGDARFWGHGDLDLAYGCLAEQVNEASLEGVDIFSADDRSCGHFQLYRNEERVNRLILGMEGLEGLLQLQSTVGLDEPQMSKVLATAEKNDRLVWMRCKSRKSELVKDRPLMGATIEPDGRLAGQGLEGGSDYRWVDGRAEQLSSDNEEPLREFLYLHWFQWKEEAQWRRLLEGANWQEKGIRLQSSDWPVVRGKLKIKLRELLYGMAGTAGMIFGARLRGFELIDKARAFVIRKRAEKEWRAFAAG